MRSQCWARGTAHSDPWPSCELCDQVAVFHWVETYPDLLLCAGCLDCFPEAVNPRPVLSQDNSEQIEDLP